MNELTKFNFSGNDVRVVSINGEPWWCASDICAILQYSNGRKAVLDNCKPKGVTTSDTLTSGGVQQLSYINESNLYRLISKCTLPSAEKFESWIYEEVLPTIRKTGSYGVVPIDPIDQVLMLAAKLTETATLVKEERLKNLALTHHIEENRPKVELAIKCLEATNLLSMNEVAKALGTGRNRLFDLLRAEKILMNSNLPYQPYIDRGYFQVKERPLKKGENTELYSQTFVTAKGLEFINNMMPDGMVTV